MNDHKNKHVRAAVDYALSRGWTLKKAGPRAHIWGRLYCPAHVRGGCMISVLCTPRVPEHHAAYIRHEIRRCSHGGASLPEEEP